jgi:predicted tellurium resistance membrane protein TerC
MNHALAMLGMINGEAAIQAVLWIIVAGVIFSLLWWLVGYCALPAPFDKVARVVLAIAAVIVLIGALMALAGHPIIRW